MIDLCLTTVREDKTLRLMEALKQGIPEETQIVRDYPRGGSHPFIIWGHLHNALDVIPHAEEQGRPYWFIDNGFWNSAKGGPTGYYRLTYRGLVPQQLKVSENRLPWQQQDWRKDGRHILIALPGEHYGAAHGLDMVDWGSSIRAKVERYTDRPIKVRSKNNPVPIWQDLKNCWAVVTHSSNAAVDAVVQGIPVFVEPSSAAAPVGCTDLSQLENPSLPDMAAREAWWRSLMAQQYTISEMAQGVAWRYMEMVRRAADGEHIRSNTGGHSIPDPVPYRRYSPDFSDL